MNIRHVLTSVLSNYLNQCGESFPGNQLASDIRGPFTEAFREALDKEKYNYLIKGSPGQGNWSRIPWFGIFDKQITRNAMSGYYIAYIFRSDMTGVYLSLSHGVNSVMSKHGKNAGEVLSGMATSSRNRLPYLESDHTQLDLRSSCRLPKMYEFSSILSRLYERGNLPDEDSLRADLNRFSGYYTHLAKIYSGKSSYVDYPIRDSVEELKKRSLREGYDRDAALSEKVKRRKGFTCEACGFRFTDMYGNLGTDYIEAHHLIPFASMHEGSTSVNLMTDFAVLCSNCHRMIHKSGNPGDLESFRKLIILKRD